VGTLQGKGMKKISLNIGFVGQEISPVQYSSGKCERFAPLFKRLRRV